MLLGNTLRWDVDYLAPPAARAAGRRRLPAQGQAARAPDRAGDGGVVHHRAASTTRSRSARWRPATGTSGTRRRSTSSRRARRAPRRRSTSASSSGWRRCSPTTGCRGGRPVDVLALRRADDRRDLRVLPPGRDVPPPTSRSRRGADGEAAGDERSPSAAGGPASLRTRPDRRERPLELGERVLLLDVKQRRYLVMLAEGGEFHSHAGFVPHADIVGVAGGRRRAIDAGAPSTPSLRPTLEDFVRRDAARRAGHLSRRTWRRSACWPTSVPGMRVFETGVGSGALSMTMLRWGADIVGYELREDFANRADANVRSFLGDDALERYRVELRDSYEGIDDGAVRPGRARPARAVAGRARTPSACCTPAGSSSPTRRRSPRPPRRARRCEGRGSTPARIEVLHRGWHIEGQAVRPDHRMVAHTGFLTVARYPRPRATRRPRRRCGARPDAACPSAGAVALPAIRAR